MRKFVIAIIPEFPGRPAGDIESELWYVVSVFRVGDHRPRRRIEGHVRSVPAWPYIYSHARNHAKRYRSELVARRVLAKLRPRPGQHLIVQPA